MEEYWSDQVPSPWILEMVLPYEAGVVMHPDFAQSQYHLTVFVNTKRLTPLIAEEIERLSLPPKLGPFAIHESAPLESRPGLLAVNAIAPMEASVVNRVSRYSSRLADEPTREPKEHLLELQIDNLNGCLYALFGVLQSSGVIPPDRVGLEEDGIAEFLGKIAAVDLTADYDDRVCVIDVAITCSDNTSDLDVESVHSLLTFCGHFSASQLRNFYGAELQGSSRIANRLVTGRYTIENLGRILPERQDPTEG